MVKKVSKKIKIQKIKNVHSMGTPTRDKDVLVTAEMLYLVRDELKADVRSSNKRIDSLDKKIDSLDKKMDSKFDLMDSKFDTMTSQIHGLALKVEEQNAQNKVVLDALTGLFQRQDRVEEKVDGFEKFLMTLKSPI